VLGKIDYPLQSRNMTATRVHFTSYVDMKGYKIVPARRPTPRPADLLSVRSTDWVEAKIVGMGGGLRRVRLSSYPLLFNAFAKVKTPGQLLAFITEYGPLTYGRNAWKGGDEIPLLLDEAASMGACFKSRGRHSKMTADLTATLSIKKGDVSVYITPVRLLDALWLQLGQALAECSEWKKCLHCGDEFPVGGTSGRRIDAKFCTDECRIKFNSLERSR
jgi:hypothetical protein